MNILVASAEMAPLAKTGGLADVVQALPTEWKKQGHNPIVVIPKYSSIDTNKYGFEPTNIVICVPISHWMEYARLWKGKIPGSDVPCYLVENQDYFNRNGIYGDPNEFFDNDRRFIFFSRAVLETAKSLNFKPDILHAHDFHTAFSIAFLKTHYRNDDFFRNCAGVFTIHNLAYQGWFKPQRAMDFACFGTQNFKGSWFEKNNSVNAMKTAIMFADKITTVSPTYSREIRWDYYGEGLQEPLNKRSADLIGVLNGADYTAWNPATDKYIFNKYDAKSLAKKQDNKYAFLAEKGLHKEDNLDLPLVCVISRLAEQKGIDILMYKLEHYLFYGNFRFALVGTGDQRYIEYFNYLSWKYPGKILSHIGYSNPLAHQTICASDFILLPSRYEPCGLTQMYALKYGTIPIVRSTGGLADTIREYVPGSGTGNGFLFINYNHEDMDFAIRRALHIYYDKHHWDKVRQNAMQSDFSVADAAKKYIEVFRWAKEKI